MVEVLVTGGAGFIGSNFVRWAHAEHPDWHITTLDKLTYAGRLENLRDVMDSPRHRFVRGDVADAAVAGPLVRAAEIVVHFAAETHVDRSILAAGEFIHTDVFGTFVLLYSHAWRLHDLVMWDNRATMHRARRFDRNEVRDVRRTTLAGDAPTIAQVA